jgi:hypothetical protein
LSLFVRLLHVVIVAHLLFVAVVRSLSRLPFVRSLHVVNVVCLFVCLLLVVVVAIVCSLLVVMHYCLLLLSSSSFVCRLSSLSFIYSFVRCSKLVIVIVVVYSYVACPRLLVRSLLAVLVHYTAGRI